MSEIEKKADALYYNTFLGLNIEDNESLIPKIMVQFAKEMCELQKQEIAKVMEDVVYDDRIGNMSYKSVNDAILNTKNICQK